MSPPQDTQDGRKTQIVAQIAELSRLLAMIPADDRIQLKEPLTQNEMVLSDWLGATRKSFLQLSLLIGRALDIQLQ